MRTLIAIALFSLPAAAAAEPFDLICSGTALHNEASQSRSSIHTDDGRSPSGDQTTSKEVRSAESLRVRISAAGAGKIKPPPTLAPPISHSSLDGWRDLSDVVVTDDAIRAQYSLNMLNHPSVLIDRHTGDINIKGWGVQFAGTCERAPVVPDIKKF